MSNPSPRLIDSLATAFRKGSFTDKTGASFGSGKYGELGPMVAALVLDRETRAVVLDADPSQGSLQEPLLRLIRIMRSLEFELKPEYYFVDMGYKLGDLIGQAPHELPTVFSFFLPEYKPSGEYCLRLNSENIGFSHFLLGFVAGPLGVGGLVCPECQVLSGPKSVDLMNGLLSLIKYGLDTAYGGFASQADSFGGSDKREIGKGIFATGSNTYSPTKGLDAAGVVDELATLLTSGRLSSEKRALLVPIYNNYSGAESYVNVQQAIVTTPEFHTTGISRSSDESGTLYEPPGVSSKPYKAIVNFLINGGLDSYNLLVPTDCKGKNSAGQTVDEQYQSVRGETAIKPGETKLRISVDATQNQPCSEFAIHPDFPFLKELYDEGSLAFFANTGSFKSSKMNKMNWRDFTSAQLFAHSGMQHEARIVDPLRTEDGTGILGRLHKALTSNGYSAAGISLNRHYSALDGLAKTLVVSSNGVTKFNNRPSRESFPLMDLAAQLNGKSEQFSSLFGKTWSSEFVSGVNDASSLSEQLGKTTIHTSTLTASSGVGKNLEMVARLMQTKDDRGIDRDLFFLENCCWDHHTNLKPRLSQQLEQLNADLRGFVGQLKSQGMWDDVVVVITSDFGRTLTTNGSDGSDHGWAGNYFVFGGKVKGGRIFGQYPYDLTEAGPYNIGNGRIMPTTAWESMWQGIVQWVGIEKAKDLDFVLPSLHDVYGGQFFGPYSKADMFRGS